MSQSNLFAMKSDAIMPPPRVLNRPTPADVDDGDQCCIFLGNVGPFVVKNSFRVQARQKWNKSKRNFQVGDVVFIAKGRQWQKETLYGANC